MPGGEGKRNYSPNSTMQTMKNLPSLCRRGLGFVEGLLVLLGLGQLRATVAQQKV